MDGTHPKDFDRRPKRRIDEDNPYTLYTTGTNTDHPHYYLSFRDSGGIKQFEEIDKTLFDAFDSFELDDLSFMNEVDNHYERSDQTEASLNRRAVKPQEPVEDIVSKHMEEEALHRAIAKLPDIQRRRLILYYFGEFTYEQIAEMEGCSHPAIIKSIHAAINNLKKTFDV
ncbi:hypothetical protein CE91St41_02840 [Oscillospiraceae bacterium]|nr:hypothetical protein CE91St40_02840 [Oscillospiraceae bacterium]BDF73395.1 hypothetical protein CE91St41_02840 [Oscillospiraceae bacterium]